jgi:hypothetical protein
MKQMQLLITWGVALGMISAAPVFAQPTPVGGGTVIPSRARFVVVAENFVARDETGVDWTGSDEILLRYSVDNYDLFTGEYGDVDWGERHNIKPEQRCIAPAIDTDGQKNRAWACQWTGRAAPIIMTISAYEYDGTLRFLLTHLPPHGFCAPGSSDLLVGCDREVGESNLIGKYRLKLTEAELVAALPRPGMSITRRLRIDGCSALITIDNGACAGSQWWNGAYDVNIRIHRVRNAPFEPPIER